MHYLKIAYIGQKGVAGVVGGVETHVRELSVRMARAGHEVIVYARPYTTLPDQLFPPTLTVRFLPSLRTKHLDTITHTLLATFHAMFSGVDIIHYQGVGPSLLAWIPRLLRPRIRVLVTFHSVDREHTKWGRFARGVLHLAEWTALTFPHMTVMTSQANATYTKNRYGKDAIVIPNGATPVHVVPPDDIHKRFGLRSGRYVLIASRLIPHKNIHLVIQAFRKLSVDLQLVIAGDESYTERYEASLRSLASDDSRIQFLGRQEGRALAGLFSHCLFYVNMSDSEGCPTATIEAMSYGKPVLLSDIPVNREVAGAYGTYVQPSVESIVEKMQEVLSRRDAFARAAREIQEYALETFDWDVILRRTINAYYVLRYHRPNDRAMESSV